MLIIYIEKREVSHKYRILGPPNQSLLIGCLLAMSTWQLFKDCKKYKTVFFKDSYKYNFVFPKKKKCSVQVLTLIIRCRIDVTVTPKIPERMCHPNATGSYNKSIWTAVILLRNSSVKFWFKTRFYLLALALLTIPVSFLHLTAIQDRWPDLAHRISPIDRSHFLFSKGFFKGNCH